MNPLHLSPDDFEHHIKKMLEQLGGGLPIFTVHGKRVLKGSDGEYEIDASVEFEALGGSYLVLVECKRHNHPIKRDVVQLLYDKLRTLGAQKGMIFATSNFQQGAIDFAQAHRITLVKVGSGNKMQTLVKSEAGLSSLSRTSSYEGWIIYRSESGEVGELLICEEQPKGELEQFLWRPTT